MSIVDSLRRASEAFRKAAGDLQALSDDAVYITGGEMSDEQAKCAGSLQHRVLLEACRLDNALFLWRIDRQKRLDKASVALARECEAQETVEETSEDL